MLPKITVVIHWWVANDTFGGTKLSSKVHLILILHENVRNETYYQFNVNVFTINSRMNSFCYKFSVPECLGMAKNSNIKISNGKMDFVKDAGKDSSK